MKKQKKIGGLKLTIRLMSFWFMAFPVIIVTSLAPSCPKRSPEFYFLEGKKLTAAGDEVNAIKYYTKAIKDKPDYFDAYIGRAELWIRQDSLDRAIQDYHKVVELKPNGDTYYRLGDAYWRSASGRDTTACRYWTIGKETYNYSKCWEAIRLHCKK